ncbi:MAG TPA: glutamine-hydrolyzing GMP synthase [Candidatus Dormibacteraeota bacterium]|nr:glutamine-hydrolyzing GMP synthase [Candidatus Dormibacteraeota bacterium]
MIAGETRRVSPPASRAGDELVLVLDFGSQTAQLIARRIREANVYCELVPGATPWRELAPRRPAGVVLSGGPASVYEPGAPQVDPALLRSGVPVLGICYGMQLIAHHLGGEVAAADRREYGPALLAVEDGADLFEGLPRELPVWMSHGDHVLRLPPGFHGLASSANAPVAAFSDGAGIWGILFHPEVHHTPQGRDLLRNFLYRVCGCRGTWTASSVAAQGTRWIRETVGDGRVICALSGGVDSAVAAMLVHRAVGDQLTCVFVDNGLLRRDEPRRVLDVLHGSLDLDIRFVDASDRFLRALGGVTDPEAKRRIVGREFISVFEREARRLAATGGEIEFLAQGTLYPDVIESTAPDTAASAAKIKTHHNVGGLPPGLRFRLVEPLRHLFKDEVRAVGLELGLPEDMVHRQPFPGPGLAIRCLGEVTAERLEVLRGADWIVVDEIKKNGLYREVWQSFAVLTPLQTVGVMGDVRTYASMVAVRVVTSEDAMTADWARLPYDVLARISNRIVNEVPGVNRVVFDVTSKPPGTIEWE